MTRMVVGIFGHRSDASLAIEALKEIGIHKKQISAVTKQKNTLKNVSENTGIGNAETGAGNEGLFGTARGLGVGLDMIADSAVAAGPAAGKLAGAGLEGDGLIVSLISSGIPEEDAQKYARHADMEHIIVMVTLEEEEDPTKVNTIFEQHDAIPLESV